MLIVLVLNVTGNGLKLINYYFYRSCKSKCESLSSYFEKFNKFSPKGGPCQKEVVNL